ncbi:hypothetical protein HELRODRAFT_158522 [Helobdella robusta]|uniref:Uncharacterized protein n=1 Tax=Helobdella robusta TaxID=6412 RepID=T1EMW6_HELRO|nr:hypothetical protein HELRODRAFT_158522 [Helobdella robusta]ESO12098.1 hypothetical protein HELRODRAFT_158522 [Helobdella robusta]
MVSKKATKLESCDHHFVAIYLDIVYITTMEQDILSQLGLSQGVISSLLNKGINSISVGVNAGTPPPAVPKLFRWKYLNKSIVASFHPGGYPNNPGPTPIDPRGLSRNDCIVLEGFKHALCFVFRTDNSGPPENVQVID